MYCDCLPSIKATTTTTMSYEKEKEVFIFLFYLTGCLLGKQMNEPTNECSRLGLVYSIFCPNPLSLVDCLSAEFNFHSIVVINKEGKFIYRKPHAAIGPIVGR